MSRNHPFWTRITNWFHGTNWGTSTGGYEPDDDRRDEGERLEFLRRKEQVRARLDRLESIVDLRAGRIRDDE